MPSQHLTNATSHTRGNLTSTNEAAPDNDHSELTLRLLGGFAIVRNGEQIAVSQPAEKLLAFLGLHQSALARPFICGQLWGGTTEERARARLRTTLWQLRSIDPPLLVTDRYRVGLAPVVTVDVNQMISTAGAVLQREGCHADAVDRDVEILESRTLPEERLEGEDVLAVGGEVVRDDHAAPRPEGRAVQVIPRVLRDVDRVRVLRRNRGSRGVSDGESAHLCRGPHVRLEQRRRHCARRVCGCRR